MVVYNVIHVAIWITQICYRAAGQVKGDQEVELAIYTDLATALDSLNDGLRRPKCADL